MNLELFPPPAGIETVPDSDIDGWLRDRSLDILTKHWLASQADYSTTVFKDTNHPWTNYLHRLPGFDSLGSSDFFHHRGPNYTADPIVIFKDAVLLIKRGDNGQWGLPGGFVNRRDLDDEYEPVDQAARRECLEETGIKIPPETAGSVVYTGPVADVRMRRQAWPETTAIVYQLPERPRDEPIGQDDAIQAEWFPLAIARQSDLYGSHQLLIELACAHLSRP